MNVLKKAREFLYLYVEMRCFLVYIHNG